MKLFYILIAIVILGFIVTVHEFGHYLVGRICGIGVVEFSVGFGPKIFGWKRKGIQYSLRAIPLGGYCSFVGEDEDNTSPDAMNSAPVWKRFLTVAAGPAMNFILAFVFCVIMFCNYRIAEVLPRIDIVMPNTPAAEAGLLPGDTLLEVNGTAIEYGTEGTTAARNAIISSDMSQPIPFLIDRDGREMAIEIIPELVVDEATGQSAYQIGIEFATRTYNVAEAIPASFKEMASAVKDLVATLKNLVFKGEGVEYVSGPVGIISMTSDLVYNAQLRAVVILIFIISLNLGVMNLLPLPALDGGRLILLIVEAIRRKPLPREKEGIVHAIGFMLLIAAILFFTYNDIVRLITGG